MFWVGLLGRFLAATGFPCEVLFPSMAKAGAVSSPLLRVTAVDCDSEANKCNAEIVADVDANGSNKCHGWLPIANSSKITPSNKASKRRSFSFKKRTAVKHKRTKSLKTSPVVINVRDSDVDYDNNACCETVIGLNGNSDNNTLHETKKHKNSVDGKSNKDDVPLPKHEYDEKLTPMGRVLLPLRRDGETGCGFNSLFISPDNALQAAVDHPKTNPSLGARIKGWFRPASSTVNMKIFGGLRGVVKEQHRMLKTNLLIHPYSTFRNYWDLAILMLLICNMIILPITITFFREDPDTAMVVFNITSDILFMIDICLNFRTGYLAPGCGTNVILIPKAIAKRYLKTWFVLDFISSLPLDYIVNATTGHKDGSAVRGASRALKFLRLVKLLSLLRLLRVSRILRYISQFEEIFHMTTSFMRYIKLISMMLLVAHWNGCLNFLVPMLQDFPSDCWVKINKLENASWTVQYSWALFKALSHMLCIGYGRFPPANLSEAYITTFSMITGATFYALFIAHSMAYLQHVDSARRQYAEKFKQIEEYMTYRMLPDQIREKLSNYYEHKYQGKMFDEEEILSEISKPLKEEIVSHNCRDLVNAVPFFKNVSALFVRKVLTQLRFEVFLPGDFIIREGTFGTEMYFIRQGSVDILVNNECTTTLNEGNYFGEICLLANARRISSACAASVCDLFVLPAASFKSILEEFPDVKVLVEHIAIQRLLELRKQLSFQAGSEEAADRALFDYPAPESNGLLAPTYDLFSRRASVKDFIQYKKQSTSIDGSTLEQLVDSHRKTAENCKLCQEDETTTENPQSNEKY